MRFLIWMVAVLCLSVRGSNGCNTELVAILEELAGGDTITTIAASTPDLGSSSAPSSGPPISTPASNSPTPQQSTTGMEETTAPVFSSLPPLTSEPAVSSTPQQSSTEPAATSVPQQSTTEMEGGSTPPISSGPTSLQSEPPITTIPPSASSVAQTTGQATSAFTTTGVITTEGGSCLEVIPNPEEHIWQCKTGEDCKKFLFSIDASACDELICDFTIQIDPADIELNSGPWQMSDEGSGLLQAPTWFPSRKGLETDGFKDGFVYVGTEDPTLTVVEAIAC